MTVSDDTSQVMIDTNMMVYAYDVDEGNKRDRAAQLIEELQDQDRDEVACVAGPTWCKLMVIRNQARSFTRTPETSVGAGPEATWRRFGPRTSR